MRLENIIKIGELLEVKVGELASNTKLIEVLEDDHFVAFAPTVKGMPIWDSDDQTFRFWFYRPNGVFQFDAEIIRSFSADNMRLCEFYMISELVKNQRREFYRLPVVLDMTASEMEDGEDGIRKPEKIRGKTIDLSEKSLKFTSFTMFPIDTPLMIDIKMTDMKTLTLKVRVYKCRKPERRTDPYEMVVLFEDQTKYHRAYISRYIMQKQIEARRKRSRDRG